MLIIVPGSFVYTSTLNFIYVFITVSIYNCYVDVFSWKTTSHKARKEFVNLVVDFYLLHCLLGCGLPWKFLFLICRSKSLSICQLKRLLGMAILHTGRILRLKVVHLQHVYFIYQNGRERYLEYRQYAFKYVFEEEHTVNRS